ncbi:MAG: peroxiredoxin-like family protein [Ignavibacteria bacterium]|nr:peroxiredoxin-like family protein [Ignavibacteria bacterium]
MLKLFLLLTAFSICTLNGQVMNVKNTKAANTANEICPVKIGEIIPEVSLKNIDDKLIDLRQLVKQKQTILVFYRGGWCPYCNLQLADLNKTENDLLSLGYQIVAISIDSPEKLKESLDKHQLKYILLSDSKAEASIAFGLAFKVADDYNKMLLSHNMNLEEASGEKHHILPVPAVFILDKEGIIQFEYVNPDYKIRLDGDILLKAAEKYSGDENQIIK